MYCEKLLIDNVMFVPLIGFIKNIVNGKFNANNEYKITKEKKLKKKKVNYATMPISVMFY